MKVNFLIYLASSVLPIARGAGVLVHNEVLRRALQMYGLGSKNAEFVDATLPIAEWSLAYASYAQAGSFFPDWGYGCLSGDDEAEASHWPPFLGAAIEHILENYPGIENSTSAQQLLTFVFGLASHQNSDATWHSIKLRDGLLRTMSILDFGGDHQAAHSILDIGGDTVLAKEFSLAEGQDGFNHLSKTWSVPIADIVAIYERLDIPINDLRLRYCMARGFAAISALRRVGSTLATKYQSKSPFMTTQLEQHYLGSIDEASTTTVLCWQGLDTWIRSRKVPPGDDVWNICEPMKIIRQRGKAGPYSSPEQSLLIHASDTCSNRSQKCLTKDDDLFQDYNAMIEAEMSLIVTSLSPDGNLFISSKHDFGTPPKSLSAARRFGEADKSPYFLTPSIAYAEFGCSLAVLESKKHLQLAVGSSRETNTAEGPAGGAVYVIPVDRKTQYLQSKHNNVMSSRSLQLRSSPWTTDARVRKSAETQNPEKKNFYFGKSLATIILHGEQHLAVLSSDKVELFRTVNETTETMPRVTIKHRYSESLYIRGALAERLYSFPLAGKQVLALASPWGGTGAHGFVYLFSQQTLHNEFVWVEDADLTLRPSGTGSHNLFGSSITFSTKNQLLFVGEQGYRRLIAYRLEAHLRSYLEVFRLHDPSSQELSTGFAQNGLLCIGNFLFISSTTEDYLEHPQVGVVRVYHLAPLYKKNSNRRNVPWTVKLVREVRPDLTPPFSQFGTVLRLDSTRGGMYISAPSYNDRGAVFYLPTLVTEATESVSKEGTVPSWLAISQQILKPRLKPIFDVRLSPCLTGYESSSKFGAELLATEDNLLIVGAPFEKGISADHRRAGKVYIYDDLSC